MDCLGTHGHSHLPLATLPIVSMLTDIKSSIKIIKDKVGYEVRGIGYPFGGKTPASNEVFSKACNFGIRCGFTMNCSVNLCVNNPLALDRKDVNDLPGYIS